MKPTIEIEAEGFGYTAKINEFPERLFTIIHYVWRPTARWAIRAAQKFRDNLGKEAPRQVQANEILREMEG